VIASLRGVLQQIGDGELILEVGGVGLRVAVPRLVLQEAPKVGQPMFLLTSLVVRESSLSLYGFSSAEQREIFELLLQVSGVGPRLALAVLSHLSPELLRSAVVNNQPDALATVPGIGRKTAEKIIFHLKDRLEVPIIGVGVPSELDTEVLAVLTTLGYSLVEAQAALQSVPSDSPEDIETRVKLALTYFAKP
jgi:Holliday junction DNA helicase RuvA